MKEVPVHVAIGLTPAQVKAFRLADNQTHEETGWDEELLKLELGDLSKAEFNISLLGFDPDELSRWIGDQEEAPEPQLDRAAELQKKWGTERGQIWEIGRAMPEPMRPSPTQATDRFMKFLRP